jgi:ubiquinone/menaquinone biosynthesis C-methylase UbiE
MYHHPLDQTPLQLDVNEQNDGVVVSGKFLSSQNADSFTIENSIPDFTFPRHLAKLDKETRSIYEKLAKEYDKFADIPFKTFKTPEHDVREKMTDSLNISKSSVVLEVGAGDGRGSEHIVKRLGKEGKLYVQELSPEFLSKAIERLKPYEKQCTIEYSIASAMHLPFADNTFDAMHHFGGFNNFSDPQRALSECVRVVKPGGKIVIGDEGMAPWLRNTEMGKIMMNSNPLLKYEFPFDIIPVEARDVKFEWIMMGAFFVLELSVGEGEPVADYFVPIPSARGGNHWIRYYGQLEGVTDDVKALAYEAQKKSGKSMHEWLDEVIKSAAKNELHKD